MASLSSPSASVSDIPGLVDKSQRQRCGDHAHCPTLCLREGDQFADIAGRGGRTGNDVQHSTRRFLMTAHTGTPTARANLVTPTIGVVPRG